MLGKNTSGKKMCPKITATAYILYLPPPGGGGDKELNTTLNKVIYVDHNNQRTTFTDPRLAFAVEKKNDKRDSFR